MSEKHKILTSMTYFSWSVGSKFDIQLLNAYLQKVVKIDGFRNFEMFGVWYYRASSITKDFRIVNVILSTGSKFACDYLLYKQSQNSP